VVVLLNCVKPLNRVDDRLLSYFVDILIVSRGQRRVDDGLYMVGD